jgi:SAM-dependent methyltransferase
MIEVNPAAAIIAAYNADLEKYGDSFRGVGWTSQEHTDRRYRVMLDLIRPDAVLPVTLLDFGCGLSHFYEFIEANGIEGIDYSGLDLSERMVETSRRKHPLLTYYLLDVLADHEAVQAVPEFDYVVMNGVFTIRPGQTYDQMLEYFKRVLRAVYPKTRVGLAVNFMSKQVDWEREDLFHLPMDTLASFLARQISRHFVIRHDYGLYEYTAYVYREPIVAAYG